MLLKDALLIKKHLGKAVEDKNHTKTLELLKELESFNATAEALKESKLGLYVNEIKKIDHAGIKESCQLLILKWKNDLKGIPAPKTLEAIAPKRIERSVSSDNVVVKSTGDKIRDKCVEMLYGALATDSDFPSKHILAIATKIEACVEQEYLNAKYKTRIRSLVSNLKDKSNPDLRQDVNSGVIDPQSFARMSVEVTFFSSRK
jgi:transcription elongation factor S-II